MTYMYTPIYLYLLMYVQMKKLLISVIYMFFHGIIFMMMMVMMYVGAP